MTVRVLLADDQDLVRTGVRLILEAEDDMEVVGEAADGQEAIRIVSELHPDVLLLDVAMPVMDGLEALPLIRESAPRTHIVMLTGVSSEMIRRRALEGGASLFIEKGIDVESLVDQIKDVCRTPPRA